MPNINTKTYVDVHTTGQRHEFSSVREYDKFLKAHNSYVVSKKDLVKMQQPKPPKESNYKKVAEQAWKERQRFVMDIKYGRKKLNVER